MTNRRNALALGLLSGTALFAPMRTPLAAAECQPGEANAESIGSRLLDRYVAAVNAHDTSSFPELFTESYIQHSGRSPDGLAAQIENFRRVFVATPDHRMQVEDRIIAGDKVVARTTHAVTYRTIDIWRVENGKFAEHWDLTDAAEVLTQLSGR
jgi:predicted SnoaL-like aldol condensation-catalyzing enzyme